MRWKNILVIGVLIVGSIIYVFVNIEDVVNNNINKEFIVDIVRNINLMYKKEWE